MTSHPAEPPAHWPPPFPGDGPVGRGQRPGTADEPPDGGGQRPAAPDEWPPGPGQRHPTDRPGKGHRAAAARPASGMPPPLADHRPETGDRPAPGHPSGAGPGPGGYPDLPDYPQNTYSPRDPYFPGYPSVPDYPPMPDYPPGPGYQPAGYPPNGYPAGAYPANGYPPEPYPGAAAAAPVSHEEYLHPGNAPASGPGARLARPAPAGPATPVAAPVAAPDVAAGPDRRAGPPDVGWAMLGYLTVPFFGFLLPLAVYLASLRRSRWLRAHAAQAVNVWLTVILYELSAAVIGAMLVLDSLTVALAVVVPLVAALWLATLAFLVRAATAARRGRAYAFPRWLCAPMVR
jgi:uncharacterized Tic20 family protein